MLSLQILEIHFITKRIALVCNFAGAKPFNVPQNDGSLGFGEGLGHSKPDTERPEKLVREQVQLRSKRSC